MFHLLSYFLDAKTRYRVHSPFVFEWADRVLDDYSQYYFFKIAEKSVSIAEKQADFPPLLSARAYQILFKTIQLYKPKNMLELGGDAGFGTMYQASGYTKGQLWRIETDKNVAEKAIKRFFQARVSNISIINIEPHKGLKAALSNMKRLDYAFLNTDNIAYFETCLEYAHNETLFVIPIIKNDTIFWENVKNNDKIRLSVRIFDIGFAWLRQEQREKEHFTLLEAKYKPWERYLPG